MTAHEDEGPGIAELGDADLILRSRSGDSRAFGELWRRHYRSGLTVARSVSSTLDADDLVQEAYTRIYQSIQKGGGPTGSFRAYLFTSIRNTAAGWGRARRETAIDLLDTMEDPATSEEATSQALDRSLTHQAFRSLPTRWQEVLWYSEIEGLKPAEIAPLLGLKATAVAQLTFRAREGLREAWIQAHLRSVADGSDCQRTIEKLGAYARNNLARRDQGKVDTHLAECARCAIVASEAKDVGSRLALVLLPLTIGTAGAAGYLASLQGGGAPILALAAMPSSVVEGAVTVGPAALAPIVPIDPAAVAASGSAAGGSAAGGGVVGGSSATVGAAAAGSAAAAAAAAGGALSGIGAFVGLATAGLVVAGAVVAAAVVLPNLTPTTTAEGSALIATLDESSDTIATPSPSATAPAPSASAAPPVIAPPVTADPTAPLVAPRTTPATPEAPAGPDGPSTPGSPVPPITEPAPSMSPEPQPTPDPQPTTAPTPDPEPTPEPTPDPEPTPEPEPTDPPVPALPEGSPSIGIAAVSFEGTRLTLQVPVFGPAGSTVAVSFAGENRGTIAIGESGSATVTLRPTVLQILFDSSLTVRYTVGELQGEAVSAPLSRLTGLDDLGL